MRPRDTLAANLRRLMEANPKLSTLPAIAAAGGPSNGTLDRARRAEAAIRLDELGRIAQVFGVEPWMLLVPDLNPARLPRLDASSADAGEQALIQTMLHAAEALAQYKAVK